MGAERRPVLVHRGLPEKTGFKRRSPRGEEPGQSPSAGSGRALAIAEKGPAHGPVGDVREADRV